MIKIKGFRKKYLNNIILEFPKLEFEKTGFYLIYGRSGCGKTTLLNCFSLIENFEGDYLLNDKKVNDLNDAEKAKIRKDYISYVHQKPVLLNDFTVFENIKLFTNLKDGEILNYLAKFKLSDKKDRAIKYLSGGEKQRVSLIKCIILQKPIILADEPTGSLDKENAKFVLETLKELSKERLVIVVSHDVNLFKEHCDSIIKVVNQTVGIQRKKLKNLNRPKKLYKNTNFKSSLIEKRYKKHIIKRRKVKNILVSLFTTISLICVSLIMLIAFNVKEELMNGFSQFYEPDQFVIENRVKTIGTIKRNSPSEEELNEIEKRTESDYRITYNNNFETFFKDGNSLHLMLSYRTFQIENFSARHFNEFKYLDGIDNKYLTKASLNFDEIVISIDNQLMIELCYQLSIPKTFNSLFKHIKENKVYLSLFIKNFDWQYEDEQIFRLSGFVVESKKFIYHSENNFAFEVFEKGMKLPSTIFDEVQEKPRYLKKEHILSLNKDEADRFFYDQYLSNFYLEKLDYKSFNLWYEKEEIINDHFYKIFKKNCADIIPSEKIQRLRTNNYSFNTSNNYYIKNSLISGFVNEIFITGDVDTLGYLEDNYFKNDLSGKIKIDENLNVVSGGMLVDAKETFKLSYSNEIIDGVSISRKLYNKFAKSLQNSTIFLIGLTNRFQNNSKIIKEYKKTEIKIGNIIDNDEEYVIYGNEFFINSFFRDYLGYEYEKYASSAVILTIDNPNDAQLLRQYFYNFNVSEPFKDVNRQIDSIINVLIIVLSIFSSIIFAISIFLLSLIIKSFILDFKEDLHVLYCNGLSKKEIAKILKTYILSTLLKATFTTIIFNLGISAVISFAVSQALKISFKYSFSIFSILASVILSLIMIFIGSLFTDKFTKKEDVVISIRN